MIKTLFLYLFFGILLLFLFHFETFYVGPIKISHLWKGVVLIFLLFSVIKRKQNTYIYRPFIWFAIFQLLNIELINNPINAFINFSTILLLPIVGIYVLRFNLSQLQKALVFFASYFILSFVPYQLGILVSFEEGYNLSAFGGASGLIGPFQNPHGAAISLASALIVILFFWFNGGYNKIYLTALFLLGFYFLLITYVRTGLAMFAIGSLPILIYYAKKQASTLLQLAIFVFFIVILASNWVLSNEVLLNRITGQSQFRSEDTFESIGSGRGGIYIASLEIFIESNVVEKIFGMGESEQIERIFSKTNMKIGSHNGFLDILLQNGIIGFVLFLFYLIRIVRCFRKIRKSVQYTLFKSLLFAFFVLILVQGFEWLSFNIVFMLSISILNHEKLSVNHARKNFAYRTM